MANQTSDKVLRIGVIQAGKVIEERVVRKRGPVSFGEAEANTFVLAGLPKSMTIFDLKGPQYQLVFREGMEGRVSSGEGASEALKTLKTGNRVERQGDRFKLTLDDNARGRVQLTPDVTILFHFVVPPPAAAPVALPTDLRGGLARAIEPIFTSVLLASFLVHFAAGIVVSTIDPPAPPTMDDLRRVVERMSPPKVEAPKVPTPTETGPAPTDTGGKGESKKPTAGGGGDGDGEAKKGGKKGGGGGGSGGVGDRTALREQLAGKGILQLIGGRGGGGGDGGAVGSVFGAGSSISDDVGSALNGTAGVGIAGAGGSGGGVTRRGSGGGGGGGDGTGGGGGGAAADIGDLKTSGGGKVDTGGKVAAKIVARVQADDVETVDGKIDKKSVASTIRRRQDGFQACYESALKSNSKLAGKIVVEFTIDSTGKVSDARVVKDGLGSSEVSGCVVTLLKRLRFPAPSDGDVTISNSFVFQPGT
jgi:hypothetical protein